MNPAYFGAAVLLVVLNTALVSFLHWKGSSIGWILGVSTVMSLIAGILLERAF
jgi:hypothetical protein